MVWNYHDDDLPGPAAAIDLSVSGMKEERVLVHHYRVDQQHSNSYEAWKAMGSPQKPSAEQYKQLERAGQLEMLGSPQWRDVSDGKVELQFQLPRQGVSLLRLSW
jgi:xylan 1,4-beta-xylosidase